MSNIAQLQNSISVTFIQGAKVEIQGNVKRKYLVQFIDPSNNSIVWSSTIETNCWTKCNRQWFTKWKIRIFEKSEFGMGEHLIYEHEFSADGKRVYIHLDSSSLGDTLAWMPYVEEYARIHNCKVICSTFWNDLFIPMYRNIEFVKPGSVVNSLYAMYVIGWWDKDNEDEHLRPSNPRIKPLQQTCSDILGIPYKELRPKVYVKDVRRHISEKYVCIATESTAGAKYWHLENGWQSLVDKLNEMGYKVVVCQKEPTNLKNIIDKTGSKDIQQAINLLLHCEFFIGLASGLAWIAWVLKKNTVMISGFTEEYTEFHENHFRVMNRNVCNGCWNDPKAYPFDKGDWYWCPRHKNTLRHFECSKQISVEDVLTVIHKMLETK